MPNEKVRIDLYTFVTERAITSGEPFPLHCKCGGVITIMPPFREESVVCPQCESRIRIMVLGGDPGYVVGRKEDGESFLIPVQGSSEKALAVDKEAKERFLRKIKENGLGH